MIVSCPACKTNLEISCNTQDGQHFECGECDSQLIFQDGRVTPRVCHVCNLHKSALSGYVSEIDAVAAGGRYLAPDAGGFFDASFARDLCVTCVNCGSMVSNPGLDVQLLCSDCGMDEFHVVQTSAPPPRRPSYAPLNPTAVPSNISPCPPDDDIGDSPVVSPWARWAARILDFWIGAFAAAFVLGIVLSSIGIDTDNVSEIGWMILAIPSGLALDALCYYFFGWTLGKWLFAVKVRHQDGCRLTYAEYIKRNFWVLVKGFGLAIPLVSLVTFIVQYNRLRAGKSASYDEGKDIKIVRSKHSVARTIFGIIALILLFIFLAACNAE